MSILFGDVANRLSHGTCNDVVLSLNDVTRSALQGPRGRIDRQTGSDSLASLTPGAWIVFCRAQRSEGRGCFCAPAAIICVVRIYSWLRHLLVLPCTYVNMSRKRGTLLSTKSPPFISFARFCPLSI